MKKEVCVVAFGKEIYRIPEHMLIHFIRATNEIKAIKTEKNRRQDYMNLLREFDKSFSKYCEYGD